ncbi:MAG: WYL domain-containing protein [Clostridiales bacterium]|nr:WYL domain-containing protein [Clostridiales bacterium]
MEKSTKKHDRVLEIYSRLLAGEVVQKKQLAEEYGVAPRSIQRDIDSIRDFCANRSVRSGESVEIKYDRAAKGFRLIDNKTVTLTNAELFTVAKILLESRSLSKEEMGRIIEELIDACLPVSERRKMADLVGNELFHYVEPRHGMYLVDRIWNLGTAVYQHLIVQLEYQKANGDITYAEIKPVGIMCSEYYFYLIAYIGDSDKKHPGYPTVYRIDRIKSYKVSDETFHVPYKDRFEEGEFRKRIQFMYGGKLRTVKFQYSGPDINAVLDRLPTAEILEEKDGVYMVSAEVYGDGIEMWLRSQGENVR